MEEPNTIAVTGMGALTAVGFDARSSAASFRAGLMRASELEDFRYYVAAENLEVPTVGHVAARQGLGAEGLGKMLALGIPALRDLAGSSPAPAGDDARSTSLYLVLPDYAARAGLPVEPGSPAVSHSRASEPDDEAAVTARRFAAECNRHLVARLWNGAGLQTSAPPARIVYGDEGHFLLAVLEAMRDLEAGRVDRCIVGGIDSYLDAASLEGAAAQGRLKVEGEPVGFIPGEGAVFIQLEPYQSALHRGTPVLALLTTPACTLQPDASTAAGAPPGKGLAAAIRFVVERYETVSPAVLIGELNGEAERAREWGYALVASPAAVGESRSWFPSISFGYTGCASVGLNLVVGVEAMRRGYAGSGDVLLWSTSRTGHRGAVLLRRAPELGRGRPDDTPRPLDRDFATGLYLEHLEEVSTLYEQRQAGLDDPELIWPDLADYDERLEAHLDALVVGGGLAVAVCIRQAIEGDFGELHAAVRVFCRQDRPDLVLAAIEALDPEDEARANAFTDALRHEMPAGWAEAFARKLGDVGAVFDRIAVDVMGYRRLPVGPLLVEMLPEADARLTPVLLRALGRLREPTARVPLYAQHLQCGEGAERAAAALALLRLGEVSTLENYVSVTGDHPWVALMIGLGGGPANLSALVALARDPAVGDEVPLAFGLLGDSGGVAPLLSLLEGAHPEAAALGLYLVTGAELFEEVLLPEPVDEDELFDDEVDAMRRGEPVAATEGAVRGTKVTQLSRDPQAWRAWWAEHGGRFQREIRYRAGQPYAPEGVVSTVASERLPRRVRALAAEELAIRYGVDLGFETDLPAASQAQIIVAYRAWAAAEGRTYEPGRWYFAGRSIA